MSPTLLPVDSGAAASVVVETGNKVLAFSGLFFFSAI